MKIIDNHTKKRKIVIIQCISSSVNYISDIRDMGFEPVLMELWVPESQKESDRKWHDDYYSLNGDILPDIFRESEKYEDNLELMKKLNPVLIIPGSDNAIEIAMMLSADLGLTGNSLKSLRAMQNKFFMQDALKNAGLRYIKTAFVYEMQDAVDFFHENGDRPVIVKRKHGGSSVGVTLCRTEEEIIKAVEMQRILILDGEYSGNVIIQEYIDGTEYVVDTVSCRGEHRTVFAMQYEKQLTEESRKIYDTDTYIDSGDEKYRYLSDYIFQVLDAIGVTYGPVHSEIMVDENGPVLIEVNCRPAGASVKRSYQDRILGCHETREALDAYLYPESFPEKIKKFGKYGHLICPAMVKNVIIPKKIFVKHLRFQETAAQLASFVYMLTEGENRIYEKTIDLGNVGGLIYLANEDADQLKKDCDYLKDLEKNHLEALFDYDIVTGI